MAVAPWIMIPRAEVPVGGGRVPRTSRPSASSMLPGPAPTPMDVAPITATSLTCATVASTPMSRRPIRSPPIVRSFTITPGPSAVTAPVAPDVVDEGTMRVPATQAPSRVTPPGTVTASSQVPFPTATMVPDVAAASASVMVAKGAAMEPSPPAAAEALT